MAAECFVGPHRDYRNEGGEAILTGAARDGSGKIVEVYPAAALRIWDFNAERYKRAENRQTRLDLLTAIIARTADWLQVSEGVRALCEASDDALDALVAALVARASACGGCEDLPPEHRALALREGWIALPQPDSLDALPSGIAPQSRSRPLWARNR